MTNDFEKSSAFEKRIKKHVIGKPHRFMAVAPLGFEETLVKELKYIGVECFAENSGCGRAAPSCHSEERSDEESSNTAGIKVAGDGKVEFTAKITEAWKAVAYSRIANRVLMEIGCFKAENFVQLEKGAAAVPWELYLPCVILEAQSADRIQSFLNIHVTCKHSRLYHSDAVAERIQKIIASKFSKDPIASARLQDDCSKLSTKGYVTLEEGTTDRVLDDCKKFSTKGYVTLEGGTTDRVLDDCRKLSTKGNVTLEEGTTDRVLDDCRKLSTKGYVTLEGGTTDRVQTQHLYVNLQDDRCTLWLDLAGEELYKRGHERFVAEAPLKETIAAAMIFEAAKIASTNNPQSTEGATPHLKASDASALITFIDPMAGSGTFSLEAAYIANGLFPGKCRDFALKHQPAFKEGTWNYLLKAADSTQCHPERSGAESKDLESTQNILRIITSDISERPISIIKHNAEASPLAEIAKKNPNAVTINPQLKDFFSYTIDDICTIQPPANQSSIPPEYQSSIINHQSSIILLNPPYGKRLAFDAPALYKKIGQKLNQLSRDAQFRGVSLTVAILAPKDDTRGGAHYTCTENLLKACPALDPRKNPAAKLIETSHGGFSLNAIFAKI
ncbi:MAG: RNA methyltransferase [Fibrobacter sp.]|nr:RNA methyltransferase [Fibrobacter sp.]